MADADDTLKTSGTPQPNSGEQPTLLTPPNSGSKPPATLADSSGAPLQYTSATQLSIPIQDLSGDALLASAPRMQFDNRSVPSLGGIPLLAKLGQGGMGAVYFGVKVLLRQEVAVKVLPLHLAQAQPDLIARFVREAQIAAGITSRHLVHVTDVSESAGLFFLVMEFVKGQSAGSCLKKVQAAPGGAIGLDEASALDICIAASQGLADAHAHGVIHRDVKPDNILIPQDAKTGALIFSEAKIADLGLARGEDMAGASLTGAQSAMGTPGFMAPEQALNARKAGKPADVFAMGVTLYALIGGSSPFKGETITETILATIQKSHEPLTTRCPKVSAATGALIERCLAKDPLQRYVDASALVEALRVCRAALGTSDSRQAAAMETLLKLQVAPEVGQAVPSSSVVGNLASSSPPAPGSFGTGTSATGSSSPSRSGGGAAKLIAAVVALVVLGIAGALYFSRSPPAGHVPIKPAAAPVEIGIACGHEKVEWVKWAIAQYAQSPAGANVQIDCIPLSPQDSQAAILLKDPRIQIFAPASSFYREAFVTEFKAKYNADPIAREENVALTPLVYLTFEDRYQEFIKKYKEVNFETLNQAMRASGWGEIANRPDWGRFTFVCSNPLEYNNGLTALALMACYHVNKDRGLTVEDVNAPSFQEWGRVFAPAFDVRGTPAQLIKDMVLKGPSTHEFILTYESAVVVNLANAEGRWGGMRVIYPKMNVWNDHPFYLLSAPWIADPQKKAASNFIDFLLSEPIQHELPKYGFRPGNPKVPILFPESPFEKYKAMGLKVDVPITIEVPHETVLEALYASAKKWIHRGAKQ